MSNAFFMSVQVLLCVLARAYPFLVIAPFWNLSGFSSRVRILLAFWAAYAIFPSVLPQMQTALSQTSFVAVLLWNALVGAFLGFSLSLFFAIFEFIGFFWGFQMGFSISQVLDPSRSEALPILSTFVNYMALWIFIVIGGHTQLLLFLARSFEVYPALQYVSISYLTELSKDLHFVFQSSFQFSLTIVGSILIANFFIGFIAKVAPQLNAMMFGMPVYMILGILLLFYTVPYFVSGIQNYFAGMMDKWSSSVLGAG